MLWYLCSSSIRLRGAFLSVVLLTANGHAFADHLPVDDAGVEALIAELSSDVCVADRRQVSLDGDGARRLINHLAIILPLGRLTSSMILCELGTPDFVETSYRGTMGLGVPLSAGEMMLGYGSYFTDEPTSDHAVYYVVAADDRVRAFLHFEPRLGKQTSVFMDFNTGTATVSTGGNYEAIRR